MKNNIFLKKIRSTLIVVLALGLIACSESNEGNAIKLPERVAEEFVDAIYNSKDIKLIDSLSTSRVSEIVYHYRSIKMIQRHVMDLSLESAQITVTDVGGDFFRQTRKDLTVELHISGKYDGGFVADDRFFLMTFEDKRWQVKRISKS